MDRPVLTGQSILVLEDEPLIALDTVECLRNAGALVFIAHCVRDALSLVDRPDLSVAVLDFGLSDGDASEVCERLNARDIPFVLYSGYENMHDACRKCTYLQKPAAPAELLRAVTDLFQ